MEGNLKPDIKRNDRLANILIAATSIVIFVAIVALDRRTIQVPYPFSFDVHVFASLNALINSCVTVVLIAALVAVKRKNYLLHKRLMLTAILLSVLFLLSYIAHHLWAGDTTFGGTGLIRYFYYTILISHIILAAVILPFILITAYRGLSGNYSRHKKIARYTWPLWLYVSISGVLVYLFISPYYT